MSEFFMIITLTVVLAIWAALVLRRPGRGFFADPSDAMLVTWLQLRPDKSLEAAAVPKARRPAVA